MRAKLIILLVAYIGGLYGQKEDYQWVMGDHHRPHFIQNGDTVFGPIRIDFTYDPVKVYYDGGPKFSIASSNASICDPNTGQLIAYSNGQAIADGQHTIIEDTINYDLDVKFGCREWEVCSYTHPVTKILDLNGLYGLQNIMMLPHGDGIVMVQSSFQYCTIFDNYRLIYHTLRNDSVSNEISLINRDKLVIQEPIDDNISACRHANGRDGWIIVRSYEKDEMLVFLLDDNGISYKHGIITGGFIDVRSRASCSNFSPDGRYFSFYHIPKDYMGIVTISEFDRCTGEFSHFIRDTLPRNGFGGLGIAFSPDSRYLYAGNSYEIFQYDMYSLDVLGSREIVATYDGFSSVLPGSGSLNPVTPDFFIPAPDGKIYTISSNTANEYLSTIEFPDEKGAECTVRQHSLKLPTNVFRNIPTFPNYRLGPLDGSPCDTLGIDNHPIAKYRYEPDTMDHLRIRFTDLSYFRPETWRWDFGDGSPRVNMRHPYHSYVASGTYNVCL
ncbi:MAG TPA: PKD domain-containing protein, partial [Saprospiraceae bacterium]|nr:PKD domain-containing protein [Saprospiraceae bacterium]